MGTEDPGENQITVLNFAVIWIVSIALLLQSLSLLCSCEHDSWGLSGLKKELSATALAVSQYHTLGNQLEQVWDGNPSQNACKVRMLLTSSGFCQMSALIV